MHDPRPIGLFDSGLGGLTVLKALKEALPNESFVYLGDVARLPYGNKSPETIRRYGDQSLNFLVGQGVKLLIIACNTASTVFLEDDHFKGLPLFNVIDPGSRGAIAVTKTGKIGVIGTATTVKGGAYSRTLKKLNPSLSVQEVACPLLVPLAEEGWVSDDITKQVLKRYLAPFKDIDTLVLGCTHYPILKEDISSVLNVKLIESGAVLGTQLREHFKSHGGENPSGGQIDIFATDVTEHFERLAGKLMHPHKVNPLELVVL